MSQHMAEQARVCNRTRERLILFFAARCVIDVRLGIMATTVEACATIVAVDQLDGRQDFANVNGRRWRY